MSRPPAANEAGLRRRILSAASAVFGILGYEGTILDDVAHQAGVDVSDVEGRFGSLRNLFLAVFEETERDLNASALEAARSVPAEGFRPITAGSRKVVELFVHPGPRQKILVDARRLLTLHEWYAIDRRFGMGAIRGGLVDCANRGAIDPGDIEALAVVVYGAVTEASFAACEGRLAIDLDTFETTLDRMLRAFTPPSRG